MRYDTGGSSSSSMSGKGPLKPKTTGSSILDEAMRKPAPVSSPAPGTTDTSNPQSDWMRQQGTPAIFQPKADDAQARWMLGQGEAQQQRTKDEAAAAAEERRAEREKILGITTGALSTTPDLLKEQLHQLTAKEYRALSPRQRAAVDFNSLLSTAVRKDLKRQERYDDVSDQQKATYDKAVENMFGKDGGSEIYAPETLAVLRQLKLDDPTDKLDDYLGLKVAITEDDLKSITEKQPAPNYVIDGRVPEEDRGKLSVVEGLVDKTQQMQQSIAKGKEMLQTFQATAAAERAGDLGRLGGSSPLASRPGLGYRTAQFTESGAPADLNTYFRTMFDALSDERQAADRPKLLEALQADLYPDELDAFMSYADSRARNARQYGASMGSTPGAEYTSPQEFRKLLGLDK